MIDIDKLARRAQRTVRDLVNRRAEEARVEIERAFERARAARRLPPVLIIDSVWKRLPKRFECPECGGRTLFEVDEWSTATGIPTEGGIRVMCEAEENELWRSIRQDRDPEWSHRNWQSDWQPLQDSVARWAATHVRVHRT